MSSFLDTYYMGLLSRAVTVNSLPCSISSSQLLFCSTQSCSILPMPGLALVCYCLLWWFSYKVVLLFWAGEFGRERLLDFCQLIFVLTDFGDENISLLSELCFSRCYCNDPFTIPLCLSTGVYHLKSNPFPNTVKRIANDMWVHLEWSLPDSFKANGTSTCNHTFLC